MSRLMPLLGASMLIGVLSSTPSSSAEPENPKPPGWLIGAGYIAAPNPYGHEVDAVNAPIPLLGYIGERLTWLGPYLAYKFLSTPVSVAGVIAPRFEGIPEDIEDGPLAGIHARRPALEAGVDVGYARLIGSARVDISGRHDGYEFSLAAREERHIGSSWLLDMRAGVVWQSAALTSYLYGVDATEARPGLDFYAPGGALNYELSVFATYRIGQRWFALGSVAFRLLDEEITSSPIVDRSYDAGGYVGVAYRFGHR